MFDVPSGAEVPGQPGGRTGEGLAGRLGHELREGMRQSAVAGESSRRKLKGKPVTPSRLLARQPGVSRRDTFG